ncbi:RNA polymerase sigma factor [Phocaeicola plebeius]|uniref:RNA polymerase sigma factor n=1 Tax=Phocaeicola plebeius TaxID=310297 RepID=UPI00307E378C
MKDTSTLITVQFLTEVYVTYRPLVFRYITGKLNGCLEAEDLVQDAFLRLLEYRSMLRPETVRSFLYTIVRNLVTDYLRRHYKKQDVMACMQERLSTSVVDTESLVIADDLSHQEKMRVKQLTPKVRTVYSMIRFEEKTLSEVAEELSIPKRTIEGYLLIGRKAIREYMKCV